MADDYSHILTIAKGLENNIKSLLDDKQHPIGRTMLSEARVLVSDISAQNKPRQLEARIKTLLKLIHESKEEGELIMDTRHSEFLHHQYEHLIMELRKFNDY